MNYTEKKVLGKLVDYRKRAKQKDATRSVKNIKLYLVGGAVRDDLMKKRVHDKDYCITGITADELLAIFPEARLVGESYPVFLLDIDGDRNTEIALARVEKKVGLGYHGTEAHADINLTIQDDLNRRDLTINAMAIDVETGELIDPYEGREDIEKKIIRATSEKFKEDPLRIVRACRFAARYGYSISKETVDMMQEVKHELAAITGERYFLEVSKVIKDGNVSDFFMWLDLSGAMDEIFSLEGKELEGHFKEFKGMKTKQPASFFRLTNEMDDLKNVSEMNAFATLFHYFSDEEVEHLVNKWKMPKEFKQLILFLNNHFDTAKEFEYLSLDEKVDFLGGLISHPLSKQAESNEEEPYKWFVSGMEVRGVKKEILGAIEKMAKKIRSVKVTPEEIEGKKLEGKEIAKYLKEKRKKKLNK